MTITTERYLQIKEQSNAKETFNYEIACFLEENEPDEIFVYDSLFDIEQDFGQGIDEIKTHSDIFNLDNKYYSALKKEWR